MTGPRPKKRNGKKKAGWHRSPARARVARSLERMGPLCGDARLRVEASQPFSMFGFQ